MQSQGGAAVLAYITSQLLHWQRTIAQEIADQPREMIVDLPRLIYDDPRPEHPTYDDLRR